MNLIDKLSITGSRSQLRRTLSIQPRIPMTNQRPLILNHISGVLVRELRGILHPRTGVSRGIGMASSVDVPPAQQGDNLLIVHSHAVEYLVAHVRAQSFPSLDRAGFGIHGRGDVGIVEVRTAVLLRGGQTSVAHVLPVRFVHVIHPSRSKVDDGSSRMLQPDVRRQYPQVRIRNLRKFPLDRFEKRPGYIQTGILRIGSLVFESHARAVRSARARCRVERSAGMPG
mmetsp:Transcript_30064/g.63749  ORF Transcript_30064/g.63749 Transcript_30064/m.63749 type:complete len:227 (+) Transcript_30064:390-1070(+)